MYIYVYCVFLYNLYIDLKIYKIFIYRFIYINRFLYIIFKLLFLYSLRAIHKE